MATRNIIISERSTAAVSSMSHRVVDCLSWQNSAEWLSQQSLSKNLSLKDESPLQTCQNAKHLSLEIQGQDSSSSQSVGQSHHDAGASGGDNSHDLSSESGQDETYGKHAESQMKPLFHMANPDFALNPSQVDGGHSMGCIPYPYSDPYFCGGLFPSYGQPAIIPPQMLGVAPARVPLPLDLADDGPIYVNAKQYHGILRRRQSRAKLEAQNKLIKARKPYLHESRHIHAINRVRGSGGRFLSTKKLQQTEGAPTSGILGSLDSHFLPQGMHSSQFASHRSEIGHMASDTPYCNLGGFSNSSQPDYQFRGISPGMGGDMRGSSSSGLVSNGARSCASVVR